MDLGGPRREFFTDFLRAVGSDLVDDHKLQINGTYAERRRYVAIGIVMGEEVPLYSFLTMF